jgi:hypothetical protein
MKSKVGYLPIIVVLITFFNTTTNAQSDSLGSLVIHKYPAAKIFDSLITELRGNGITEIIKYAHYNGRSFWGVIIWKSEKNIKGVDISLRNEILKTRNIKKRKIEARSIDSLFSNSCEKIWTLNASKKAILSEDPIVHFKRYRSGITQEIFYMTSNFIGSEQMPCFSSISSLSKL